jgi:hypothetical protein
MNDMVATEKIERGWLSLRDHVIDIAKVVTATTVILGAVTFFVSSNARDWVINIIDGKHFASDSAVKALNAKVNEIVTEQNETSRKMERIGVQIDNIEKMATESRLNQMQLLMELRRK